MTPREIATDIEEFFKKGAQLLESHVPALVERAQQAETNPLVIAVENAIHLPDSVKNLAADFITKLAAEFPPPPPEAPEGVDAQPDAPAA